MGNFPKSPHKGVILNGISIPHADVHMIRQTLADIPPVDLRTSLAQVGALLPKGYRIRSYSPGDACSWVEVIRAAERFIVIDDQLFEGAFGSYSDQLPDRMFQLESISPNGSATLVGTATAWWKQEWVLNLSPVGETEYRGEWGQVHWVAINPDHQGNGLSKVLMKAVMNRMAQSHNRAMLGTSTARIWAIKVYLDLGFVPEPEELHIPTIRHAWNQVHKALNHPRLEDAMRTGAADL